MQQLSDGPSILPVFIILGFIILLVIRYCNEQGDKSAKSNYKMG